MSPSTDQRASPQLTPDTTRKNYTTSTLPDRNHQKRSSSWLQYHPRHTSNPFFLSRRAREQGGLRRDKRSGRQSVTLDERSNDLEGVLLTNKPDSLLVHIPGISEEVTSDETPSHRKKVKVPGLPHNVKTPFRLGNRPLPQADITTPTYPTSSPGHPPNLLDDGLVQQNLSCEEGIVRRRIMRTVSHEDYLLARGANPRTGVVTPFVHSGSSLTDDQDFLGVREMPQHPKWRLKGDQWVSLSLDEPTPLPSPPSEPDNRQPGRLLRIPPKLTHGRNRDMENSELQRIGEWTAVDDRSAPFHQPGQQNKRDISTSEVKTNRTKAIVVPARSLPRDQGRSGKPPVIKRKALGTPPRQQSVEVLSRRDDLPEASTETVITKTGPIEQIRSSSMPTPRKIRFFRPEDVGKALPALPDSTADDHEHENLKAESPSKAMPFLGLRPGGGTADVLIRPTLISHHSRKRLPCQPTNDIQFRSHRLENIETRRPPAMTMPTQTSKPENYSRKVNFLPNTEGRSTALPRPRPMIPPRDYRPARLIRAEQQAGQQSVMDVFDASPSKPAQPTPQAQTKTLNSQMITKMTGVEAMNIACTHPSTITPTITPTTTVPLSPEDKLVDSSWREIPSPLRLGRQRANTTTRPAMPGRAEGTQNVPKVNPQREVPGQYQKRMTGMSDSSVSANNTPVEGSPKRDLIPRALRPSNGNTADLDRLREVAAKGAIDAGQPRATCARCQESSLGDKRLNTHGFTHTRGSPLEENIDPQVDLSCTSGFLQGTRADHAGCCPECCVVGCHGSCLGHRSPSVDGSASGLAGSFGAVKEAFRNSMKLSRRTRTRTSAGGSQETETEEVAELETPTPWEMGGPVSLGLPCKMGPQTFWDGGGSDATDSKEGKRIASNASGSSVKTLDMPTNASIGTIVEALVVPFGALKMWLKKHPQLLALMQLIVVKLLEMSKHVFDTAGKAYRVAYIYSKTGRISPGKSSSVGGFVRDCVKAVVYCLVLGAVAMLVGRVLAVFARAGSWLVWSLSWVVWIVKAVGLGILW
ncbi:hypothetical protein GJ744_007656 [Endocarpon pusillum]|uniref:Uncharacterized protein n=1 Tax=Endocarpon pusillum TaxID=364733 RepID=A0A8H7AIE3_9EURO|nr:hypothetical protein GJ744_007656 [Endocarpon pusillum]